MGLSGEDLKHRPHIKVVNDADGEHYKKPTIHVLLSHARNGRTACVVNRASGLFHSGNVFHLYRKDEGLSLLHDVTRFSYAKLLCTTHVQSYYNSS